MINVFVVGKISNLIALKSSKKEEKEKWFI